MPGTPEQSAGVTDALAHVELAVPRAHTTVPPPPAPNLPPPPGQLRCGASAARWQLPCPQYEGAVRLKAGSLDLIPHVSCFISLSLPYMASVCFYKYFTSLAKAYFISLLNLLNINAATTLP